MGELDYAPQPPNEFEKMTEKVQTLGIENATWLMHVFCSEWAYNKKQ